MLVKFKQKRMVQTTRCFELFWQKKRVFYNHFWQRVDAILEDVSFAAIVFNAKDYHLSLFQTLWHSDTCNQVKSCTKQGRPDQSQRELTVALKYF